MYRTCVTVCGKDFKILEIPKKSVKVSDQVKTNIYRINPHVECFRRLSWGLYILNLNKPIRSANLKSFVRMLDGQKWGEKQAEQLSKRNPAKSEHVPRRESRLSGLRVVLRGWTGGCPPCAGSKSGIVTNPGFSSRFAELHRSQRPQGAGASKAGGKRLRIKTVGGWDAKVSHKWCKERVVQRPGKRICRREKCRRRGGGGGAKLLPAGLGGRL